MPPPYIESTPPPQTLLRISRLTQGTSSTSHSTRASFGAVMGFLALSVVVTGIAAACILLVRNPAYSAPARSQHSEAGTGLIRGGPGTDLSPFRRMTKKRCLRKFAITNAARRASSSSTPSPSGLRPLLLGRLSNLSSEQQEAILEEKRELQQQEVKRHRERKRAHRASEIILVSEHSTRSSFPFGSPSRERARGQNQMEITPPLRRSKSCPALGAVRDPDASGTPSASGCKTPEEDTHGHLMIEEVSRNAEGAPGSTPPVDTIPEHPNVSTTDASHDETNVYVQYPTSPRTISRRDRKNNTDLQRSRRLRNAVDARRRRHARMRVKRPSSSISILQKVEIKDDDVFGTPAATKSSLSSSHLKRQTLSKTKANKCKGGGSPTKKRPLPSSKSSALASSPRKPLGVLTNAPCSPLKLKSPSRGLKPLLHINGILAEDNVSLPPLGQSRIRSPPRNGAFLSTRWKPRARRSPIIRTSTGGGPPLIITVFVKQRRANSMYPGRRLTVNPPAGTTLAELRSEIERVVGAKVGILKGMTVVGSGMVSVPLMTERFYGQWVKERTKEGGVGVVEVMRIDA